MTQKELEKEIRKISKRIKRGDAIKMLYDGEEIASYEFVDWSIDSKNPIDWLRGCLCFEISLKNRSIEKVSLKFC